jgi:putative NIF3 family GTP cyclohydrolase 1 type 2
LWQLACAKISIYCPHTAWDSADDGINAQIAKRLGLLRVQPLVPETCATPDNGSGALGVGRFGELSQSHSMAEVANLVSQQIPHCRMRGVDCGTAIRRIGIVCGSGGGLLSTLLPHRCELFLTGEATFHQCLEAEAAGVSMLLIGHFASEKFAMDELARRCGQHFSAVRVWGSEHERDPVRAFPFEN